MSDKRMKFEMLDEKTGKMRPVRHTEVRDWPGVLNGEEVTFRGVGIEWDDDEDDN